jgi:hypothetical protein
MSAEPEAAGGQSAVTILAEAQMSNATPPRKPLAASWSGVHGQFDQIWRSGDVAIFEQHRIGVLIAYEVVNVQKIPAREIFGKFYPAHEAYPPFGKEWSPGGWSFSRQHRQRAFEFAQQLIHELGLPGKDRRSSSELLEGNKRKASEPAVTISANREYKEEPR